MSITVLLADDHAIVRDSLRLVLEAQPGLEVVGEAANGRAAVRESSSRQPDVVIMDLEMPDLNGIEATHCSCLMRKLEMTSVPEPVTFAIKRLLTGLEV